MYPPVNILLVHKYIDLKPNSSIKTSLKIDIPLGLTIDCTMVPDSKSVKKCFLKCYRRLLPSALLFTEVCGPFYEREPVLWKVFLQTLSPKEFGLQKEKIHTLVKS